MILTTSFFLKFPSTFSTPIANKLTLPAFRMSSAHSLTWILPFSLANLMKRCFAESFCLVTKWVPAVLVSACLMMSFFLPFAMIMWKPESIAIFAALILVNMPPMAKADPDLPAAFSISLVILVTFLINCASLLVFGFLL